MKLEVELTSDNEFIKIRDNERMEELMINYPETIELIKELC
jgi:hypothetical protein